MKDFKGASGMGFYSTVTSTTILNKKNVIWEKRITRHVKCEKKLISGIKYTCGGLGERWDTCLSARLFGRETIYILFMKSAYVLLHLTADEDTKAGSKHLRPL